MQPPMKTAPPPRNDDGEEHFTPDFSEGAEVGVYLALLELIDEGLLIIGDESVIDANSAACRLLGRSYRQLAGQPLADLFANGHTFLEARERLLIRGEARGTLSLLLPDGRVHDFPYIAAPRLRPGIHAIVLGYERLSADAPAAAQTSLAQWPLMTLCFQPQVYGRTGTLHAGEAMLYGQPPTQDALPDEHFAAAVTAICRAAATWPHILKHAPIVSINIAAGQIPGGFLPQIVQTALAASQLDPSSLEMSIDARALSLPEPEITPTFRALADMRVRLALDHFGHAPAPLALLSRYRFSVLKLDAQFSEQVGRNDEDTALVEAICNMAAPLGIQVMARGVQNKAQQDFLLALGCELQQGPFIGEALDEHVFAGFLSERFFC
ncbi:MAG: EAL domain-containing protein [Azoarcus sp.]|jgi:EAL domain-containing protein (putative c-di-GMP-specific phosphodiesterase class I)|nr:EAL domain-containing protein [Azoarcus sp.]